jgi:DNA polymerase III epsilon subunit-like protein
VHLLYLDCETTGLDPLVHDILELAYILEIDGAVAGQGCLPMRPYRFDTVDDAALRVNRISRESLADRPDPNGQWYVFVNDIAIRRMVSANNVEADGCSGV